MEPALQRRVQRYGWDKAAAFYENYWQQQLEPATQLLLKLAGLRRGEQVVDIACGTGLVSFPAAAIIGDTGSVLGTDISDKMVAISTDIAKERKLGNIHFQRMEAEELMLPDKSFDAALCALGLMYVTDALQALKQMYLVLRPGGRAVTSVWGQRKNCGWSAVFEIVDKRVASEVCPMFFNLGNPNNLLQYMAHAGFKNIVTEKISHTLIYATDEAACGAAFIGGPVTLAYNRFSEEVKQEVQREYLDSIKMYRTADGYHVPGEFVVACGYKEE